MSQHLSQHAGTGFAKLFIVRVDVFHVIGSSDLNTKLGEKIGFFQFAFRYGNQVDLVLHHGSFAPHPPWVEWKGPARPGLLHGCWEACYMFSSCGVVELQIH